MLFFFFAAYLDLRCTTRNDVLEAMEKTRNNYPEANFNPLTNEKGIILPTENPPSDKAVKEQYLILETGVSNQK